MESARGSSCSENSSSVLLPSSQQEEEINIYLKIIKTVALSNVKRSETISNLKALLCEKEGVSENFQELYFSGERLSNDHKLIDCGIEQNSTLHLFLQTSGVMKLFVIIVSNQKTIEIEAKIQDTIENIKSKVSAKEGILSDQYSLFHAGMLLDNLRTLGSLGIRGESTLHLVFNPRDVLSVSVKVPNGEIVKMEVKLLYTVRDVKAVVGSMAGFPVGDQCLIYEGKKLEDSKTLALYDLKEDSVLEISPLTIQIFVKVWSGKTITLHVQQNESISSVKNRVFHKLRRQPNDFHYLVFGGKRLENGSNLASYGIEKQSTLNMVFWPRNFFPVKLSTIGEFQTGIQSSTPIGELKKLIERKWGNPVKEVFLGERPLEDQFSLGHYGILYKDIKLQGNLFPNRVVLFEQQ
ncbi:hypothetical protein LguiA_001390 [Lonicera macranthoides]